MITWHGTSPNWRTPISTRGHYVMPLVEESVLDVTLCTGYIRLSKQAALNCTSRLALRVALAGTGLNPDWRPYAWLPGVVKAPASCMNSGVRFLPATEYTDKLQTHCPELAPFGVVEEKIEGRHFEQDGFVVNGKVYFFRTLEQFWDGPKIREYRRSTYPGIEDSSRTAVAALGLNNCPFCFEFIASYTGLRLIDAHARLGEDPGLPELMSDEYPLDVIAEAVQNVNGFEHGEHCYCNDCFCHRGWK